MYIVTKKAGRENVHEEFMRVMVSIRKNDRN